MRVQGFKIGALILSTSFLVNCGDVKFATQEVHNSKLDLQSATENYAVPAIPQIDILFVIDNSGSMADEQAILANSFANFISTFVQKNLDFHIGVISTDVNSTNKGKLLSKSSELFLTNASANLVQSFKNNAQLGTSGSGAEQGLESMYQALDPALIGSGGYNNGFIRDGALLSVIFVTDEDEDISNGETVAQRIQRTIGRVTALKGANFRTDYIINLSAAVQTNVYPSGNLPYPNVYLQAAAGLGVTPINVEADFSAPLSTMGDSISSQVQSQFALSHSPQSGSIQVKIDGAAIAQDSANGWSFNPTLNKIILNGNALASAAGHLVTITYLY